MAYRISGKAPGTAIQPTDVLVVGRPQGGGVFKDFQVPASSINTPAPNVSTRSLNAAFQPSASRTVEVKYSVKQSVSSLLLGSAEAKCELLSDAANPPTTVRDTISTGVSGVLNLVQSNTLPLAYKVPAGHYVKMLTSTVSGTVTQTLISQCETTLG